MADPQHPAQKETATMDFDFDGDIASTVCELVLRGDLKRGAAIDYLISRGAPDDETSDFIRDSIAYASQDSDG